MDDEQVWPTIRADVKARWLEALRSTDYGQTTGELRNSMGGFCCLGVLCDVAAKSGVGRWRGDEFKASYAGQSQGSEGVLPDPVAHWAGMGWTTDTGGIEALKGLQKESVELADLNDSGFTFAQIADVIDYAFDAVPA